MNTFLFIIIWAILGAPIVAGLAKMFPDWEIWKVVTCIVLGGPLIWLILAIWAVFLEKGK